MRLDRARRHSSGMISAEITVTAGKEPLAKDGHLHHSALSNLLGPRIRSETVKALSERISDAPWDAMLEVALEYVIRNLREGEPIIPLLDVPVAQQRRWRLSPILHEGHPTILFGYGGSLKSYLSHYWAIRIALGEDAEPGNVLVLDWESTQEAWAERQAMLCCAMGIELPPNLYYRRCTESLANDADELQKAVGEAQAEVVIVDSAAYACGDEPEKAGPTMDFFRALRKLNCTSLIIAHQNSDSKSQKPFGSIFWENSARSTIQVRRSEEEESSEVTVGLYNRKVNYGRKFAPFAIKASFHEFTEEHYTNGDFVALTSADIKQVPELSGTNNADKVLAFIEENGPVSGAQVEHGANIKNGTRVYIKRLADKGLIAQDSASRWVVAGEVPSQV
jgi:KaiC/GvpD/RAD55 family RecA-like ATPase